MNSLNEDLEADSYSNYCIRVNENIYQKIDRAVRVLKQVDTQGQTKQKWLVESIREKLEIETKLSPDDLPKEKQLNIKLACHLRKKVNKRVELIKKFRTSYSIKQWIMDAIFEKLDRDNDLTKKIIEEISGAID